MLNSCNRDIAIVSARCRFPGAGNLDAFWRLLVEGGVSIRNITGEEARASGVSDELLAHPDFMPRAGVLDDIFRFDAGYFGFSALEARALDVQQRLLLEECASLLEQAGYEDAAHRGSVGVFATSASSTYLSAVREDASVRESLSEMRVQQGHDKDYVATRLAHKLDLRGPALSVQTACSSGLVAVHQACQSLILSECDMAIACAAAVRVPQHRGYVYRRNGILSRNGHCRPLDPAATGTVFTNGVAAVLLKRLADAVRDGDDIMAVVKGSAVNNDGATKVGFAAPSVSGQAAVMSDALARSGISRDEVSFIEMHATGTVVGDPLELQSVRRAYGSAGIACGLGSVKGNIGHTGHVSGMAGLLKAALMLSHRQVVATPGCTAERPAPLLKQGRLAVSLDFGPWVAPHQLPRSCGVSAFGIGGTNAHLVLQEAGEAPPRMLHPRPRAVLVSARDAAALVQECKAMAALLRQAPCDEDFARIAFTSQVGRRHEAHRVAVFTSTAAQAAGHLERAASYPGGESSLWLWLNGADIAWAGLWGNERPRRGGLAPRYRRLRHLEVEAA